MTSQTFSVPNISCNHCVMTIERTLKTVPGVSDAHADLPTKSVSFSAADDAAVERARIGAVRLRDLLEALAPAQLGQRGIRLRLRGRPLRLGRLGGAGVLLGSHRDHQDLALLR